MFSHLILTDRQEFNPADFCFSFKNFDGEPVNVSVQQDAQEFLNMIFDKLENGISRTPFKKLLNGVYGGSTCNQLKCSSCGMVRNRIEQFYNLSVEVKNQTTLNQSFEKLITPEIINDFKCEGCNKSVDVSKRVCLEELPNVMIIHLQRMYFDYDEMKNVKINSRLDFPREINLEPFTRTGL